MVSPVGETRGAGGTTEESRFMAETGLAEKLEECTERCRVMDGPLATRLQTLADDVRALSPEFAEVVDRMVARLKSSGAGEMAPQPGEPMPNFILPDQNGRLVELADVLRRGPAVIAFHRGHWCPYCRINASALAAIHADIRNLGATLVAITPEIERFSSELTAGDVDQFPILSDMDNGYALLLNLAFFVGEEKQRAMTEAGWDIAPYQGNGSWMLPIPATFVTGRDGFVKARFIDPDYRRRMDTEAILDALRTART
jgi:peroxiredoxin